MGLHLPRSATRIKLWSRCHDTHAGAHLRIVFPLGDAHIDMRMRMSCARGDGARPITESGTRCRGSSTARSSTVAARPSSCGLSAATCGTFRATRAPPVAVFFFAGCFPAPFSVPFFALAAAFVGTRFVAGLGISSRNVTFTWHNCEGALPSEALREERYGLFITRRNFTQNNTRTLTNFVPTR